MKQRMNTLDISSEFLSYQSPSEVIESYYKNQQTNGLEEYFYAIERWIEKPRDKVTF